MILYLLSQKAVAFKIIVSCYSTFKERAGYIQNFIKDLNKLCKDNFNIEAVHTARGFEDLYLLLFKDGCRVNVDADHVIIRTDGPIYEIVNQGSTKTESYIHKINADEDITQSWIIFKTELPFFDGKLQYTFTN